MAPTGTHTRRSMGAQFAPTWANIPLPQCKRLREKRESLCKLRNWLELWYVSTGWGSFAWSTETSSDHGSRLLMPRCSTNASAHYCNTSSVDPDVSWDAQ